jgi:hypothetical protein
MHPCRAPAFQFRIILCYSFLFTSFLFVASFLFFSSSSHPDLKFVVFFFIRASFLFKSFCRFKELSNPEFFQCKWAPQCERIHCLFQRRNRNNDDQTTLPTDQPRTSFCFLSCREAPEIAKHNRGCLSITYFAVCPQTPHDVTACLSRVESFRSKTPTHDSEARRRRTTPKQDAGARLRGKTPTHDSEARRSRDVASC